MDWARYLLNLKWMIGGAPMDWKPPYIKLLGWNYKLTYHWGVQLKKSSNQGTHTHTHMIRNCVLCVHGSRNELLGKLQDIGPVRFLFDRLPNVRPAVATRFGWMSVIQDRYPCFCWFFSCDS